MAKGYSYMKKTYYSKNKTSNAGAKRKGLVRQAYREGRRQGGKSGG